MDITLGYGPHEDMVGAFPPTIIRLRDKTREEGRKLFFVATVCGTRGDLQGYDKAVETLKGVGVIVCKNSKLVVYTVIRVIGLDFREPMKRIHLKTTVRIQKMEASERPLGLLPQKPRVISVGLKGFVEVIKTFGRDVVRCD